MHSTEGIVLKKLDVGEHDTLYSIYTRDFGKMRALAQGIRKEEAKLRGHLEPLSHTRIQFILGKGGEKLIGATLADFLPVLRSREHTLRLAGAIAADIDTHCFPGEPDEGVWGLVAASLAELNRDEFSPEQGPAFLADFRRGLRERLGYGASDEETIV